MINKFKKLICISIILAGAYIWFFEYFPAVIFEKDNFRYVITRHCFYYLQILMTLLGFTLLHLGLNKKIKAIHYAFYFALSTIIVYTRTFHELHEILKQYDLYPGIFKTKIDKDGVPYVASFQYARIIFLMICGTIYLYALLFKEISIQRIMLGIFTVVFFLFFYFMHLNIGKSAYLEYEKNLKDQYQIILDNYSESEKICPSLGLNCFTVKNEKEITDITISKLNNVDERFDSTEEAKNTAKDFLENFIKSEKDSQIITESDFVTNNLRAATYSFKKINDGSYFILIDFNELAYALDLYLIIYTIIVNLFLLIWIPIFIWLTRIHSKNNKIIQIEKARPSLKISLRFTDKN